MKILHVGCALTLFALAWSGTKADATKKTLSELVSDDEVSETPGAANSTLSEQDNRASAIPPSVQEATYEANLESDFMGPRTPPVSEGMHPAIYPGVKPGSQHCAPTTPEKKDVEGAKVATGTPEGKSIEPKEDCRIFAIMTPLKLDIIGDKAEPIEQTIPSRKKSTLHEKEQDL